ncbi:MAG: hypothetical protein AB9856_14515 [Cellulosilyticaceae bacterium]
MALKWVRKPKKKRQYTKIIMDLIIGLTLITTLASIYINYRNGLGMDSIVSSCWGAMSLIIPSYCAKSFLETREENKNSGEDDVEC